MTSPSSSDDFGTGVSAGVGAGVGAEETSEANGLIAGVPINAQLGSMKNDN